LKSRCYYRPGRRIIRFIDESGLVPGLLIHYSIDSSQEQSYRGSMKHRALLFTALGIMSIVLLSCVLLADTPPEATVLPVRIDEIGRIGSVFGINNYGGEERFHGGIDFNPKPGGSATFYVVADGVVTKIDRDTGQGYDGDKGARNYRIELGLSTSVTASYHFEAALNEAGEPLSEEEVESNIYVAKGQKLVAGEPIGLLPYRCEGTHVHFSIMDETGEHEGMPSIYDYFDESTAQALKDLVAGFNGT